ncbi:MAG: glycosyltransferase family 39 protein [Acidobacteriota bacterium]
MVTKTHPVPKAGMTITASQLMLAFGALFVLNLLLRVFYIRYDFVNGDEGVRALTATRMLEGARLYADVVTDKPPGASLFYAAVFAVFGRSMKAVHAAAIVWNFATSFVVYLIAARFYNKRIGLWAMLFFVYFSTNYFTQDMMAANTELLMALPYAAAFYFFILGNARYVEKGESASLAPSTAAALVAAGLLSGLAAMFKQIGVLNLGFFALYQGVAAWRTVRTNEGTTSLGAFFGRVFLRLSLVGVGFALVLAALVVWLKSSGALGDFWRNGIVLNMFYIDSEPFGLWMKFMLGRGLGYVFFNATLWLLAAWAVWRSARQLTRRGKDAGYEAGLERCDVTVAVWALVSLVGVVMSGRFYGHYFIPALPALSLLAARGSNLLAEALIRPAHRRKTQAGVAALALLFLPGLFRCHHRTAVLAYETVTGTRTRWSGNWGMTKREQEAEVVSDFVRAGIPAGEPLYIWGYAHDVFWRTGCRPASRYLTPYYIDGRFADAEATVPASGQEFRREAAANLLEDLRRNRPRLILDVEGGFKALPHAELVEFIEKNYRDQGSAGPDASRPFRVLELNDDGEKDEDVEGRS